MTWNCFTSGRAILAPGRRANWYSRRLEAVEAGLRLAGLRRRRFPEERGHGSGLILGGFAVHNDDSCEVLFFRPLFLLRILTGIGIGTLCGIYRVV